MHTIAERGKRILSLNEYAYANEPEHVAQVSLYCPFERQYILRMLIKNSLTGFRIPPELSWLSNAILLCQNNQERMGIRQPYCYVTVRHGIVDSVTDDLWHVDGFSTKITHIPEQNYIFANCIPTEYVTMPLTFPVDFDSMKHNIHLYIQNRVSNEHIRALEANTIYCMDPYVIHRRPPMTAGIMRTFVRISFTPILISDDTNTQNEYLPMPRFYYDGVKDFRDNLLDYDKENS